MRSMLVVFGIVLCALVAAPRTAGGKGRRELPDKFEKPPYSLMSLSVGHPNDGWQVRAIRLKNRSYIRVRSKSKSRAWGHPALVKMLYRTARDISRTAKGSRMLIGDLSRKKGGPLSGHHSHQSGRDADVAFYAKKNGRSVKMKRFVAFDGNGEAKNGSDLEFDDYRNWLLVQSWLKDHRAGISFIFVSRPLRKRLLDYARNHPSFKKHVPAAAKLMREPKNADAHDDHFHVRISCPKRQEEICHEHPR